MTFHEEIESRYRVCRDKTSTTTPTREDATWFLAYAIMSLMRAAAMDGVIKDAKLNAEQEGAPHRGPVVTG